MEVKLPTEKAYIELPFFVNVIKEVTLDTSYDERTLAKNRVFL